MGQVGARIDGMAPEAFDRNCNASQVRKLHRSEVSKAEIARRLNIGRTSGHRILGCPISGRNSVALRILAEISRRNASSGNGPISAKQPTDPRSAACGKPS